MRATHGFTLVEILIVVVILGILAAIAIPAYQDYSIRAKVSEAINTASPAKLAVAEFYQSEGNFPTNRTASGASQVDTKYVNGLTITSDGSAAGPARIFIDVDEAETGVDTVAAGDMFIQLSGSHAAPQSRWAS